MYLTFISGMPDSTFADTLKPGPAFLNLRARPLFYLCWIWYPPARLSSAWGIASWAEGISERIYKIQSRWTSAAELEEKPTNNANSLNYYVVRTGWAHSVKAWHIFCRVYQHSICNVYCVVYLHVVGGRTTPHQHAKSMLDQSIKCVTKAKQMFMFPYYHSARRYHMVTCQLYVQGRMRCQAAPRHRYRL